MDFKVKLSVSCAHSVTKPQPKGQKELLLLKKKKILLSSQAVWVVSASLQMHAFRSVNYLHIPDWLFYYILKTTWIISLVIMTCCEICEVLWFSDSFTAAAD